MPLDPLADPLANLPVAWRERCRQLLLWLADHALDDKPAALDQLPPACREPALLHHLEAAGLAVGVVWCKGSPGSSGLTANGGTPYVVVGAAPGWYVAAHLSHKPAPTHARLTPAGRQWVARERAVESATAAAPGAGVQGTDAGLSGKAKALALLVEHPDWSNTQIAKEVGCSRTTLYNWPSFKAAREAQKDQARASIPRGSVTITQTKNGKDATIDAVAEE